MDKITKVTPQVCDQMRVELNQALKVLGDKFGVTFVLGNMTYSDIDFSTKLQMKVGQGEELERKIWNEYSWSHGFEDKDFGSEFTISGRTAVVSGYKPKARQNKIRFYFKGDSSKQYTTSVSELKKAFTRRDATASA
ncbi:hypothetical protein HUO09_17815 [Vibrio sp. Y2-5]|uniref:hypothetical protein n=1 Tax=Vibrio sp. Y2-5 TaxID=2743977 RepID=UPI001661708A|nr:hypothetical protein [Vibrio sp. Y2-5]MBD0788216.1 hypothetical protein [Vibrio sp. Y2-5]